MDKDNEFETPSRETDEKEAPRTTIGGATESRYQKMVESKYEANGEEDEANKERNEHLDSIEREIKENGKRL